MLVLDIAGSKIYAQSNSIIISMCKFLGHMLPFVGDTQYDLHFVVDVFGKIRIVKILVVLQYGCIGFEKDDGLFGDRIMEFFCVIDIVAAYGYYLHGRKLSCEANLLNVSVLYKKGERQKGLRPELLLVKVHKG